LGVGRTRELGGLGGLGGGGAGGGHEKKKELTATKINPFPEVIPEGSLNLDIFLSPSTKPGPVDPAKTFTFLDSEDTHLIL
jgi:hypothetical protein